MVSSHWLNLVEICMGIHRLLVQKKKKTNPSITRFPLSFANQSKGGGNVRVLSEKRAFYVLLLQSTHKIVGEPLLLISYVCISLH